MSTMWDYADEDKLVAEQHPEWFMPQTSTPEEVEMEKRLREEQDRLWAIECWWYDYEAARFKVLQHIAGFCPECHAPLGKATWEPSDPSVGIRADFWYNEGPTHGGFEIDYDTLSIAWEPDE